MTNLSNAYKMLNGTTDSNEQKKIKDSIENIILARILLVVTFLVFTLLTISVW